MARLTIGKESNTSHVSPPNEKPPEVMHEDMEVLVAFITDSSSINFAFKLSLKAFRCGSICPWSIRRTIAEQLLATSQCNKTKYY